MTRDEAAAFVADAKARQQANRRQRYSRGSKLRRYRGQLIRLQEAAPRTARWRLGSPRPSA